MLRVTVEGLFAVTVRVDGCTGAWGLAGAVKVTVWMLLDVTVKIALPAPVWLLPSVTV